MKALLLVLGLSFAATAAQAECRQALVLALDVSGSVDDREYALQIQGLASALEDPRVVDALLSTPDTPVNLTIFEWSGSSFQRQILGWTAITDRKALTFATSSLRATRRQPASAKTSIGGALRHAAQLLGSGPDCWIRTIDISGDGMNNDHPLPIAAKKDPAFMDITVNALVIAIEIESRDDIGRGGVAELTSYFEHRVIHGPGAFVELALGFEEYHDAMVRKLLKELQTAVIGRAPTKSEGSASSDMRGATRSRPKAAAR